MNRMLVKRLPQLSYTHILIDHVNIVEIEHAILEPGVNHVSYSFYLPVPRRSIVNAANILQYLCVARCCFGRNQLHTHTHTLTHFTCEEE